MTINQIDNDYVVTFGKFKGRKFSELCKDKSYYFWLIKNWKELSHNFKAPKKVFVPKPEPISYLKEGVCILCDSSENPLNDEKCCDVCCNLYNRDKIPKLVVQAFKDLDKKGLLVIPVLNVKFDKNYKNDRTI